MIKKSAVFVILILAVLSLTIAQAVFAQSISKPSVPVFTVKYVNYSYDVPATYGLDQSTAKNVTLQAGYHVDNKTVEFAIKNQPFTPFNDSNSNSIGLYYNFRAKGHNQDKWVLHPFAQTGEGTWQSTYITSKYYQSVSPLYAASNAGNSVVMGLDFFNLQDAASSDQVDFEVQALTGHIDPINSGPVAGMGYYSFTGDSSDWSNTQTISIGTETNPTSISASSSSTPIPTAPEFPSTILLISLVAMAMLIGTLVKRNHNERAACSQN